MALVNLVTNGTGLLIPSNGTDNTVLKLDIAGVEVLFSSTNPITTLFLPSINDSVVVFTVLTAGWHFSPYNPPSVPILTSQSPQPAFILTPDSSTLFVTVHNPIYESFSLFFQGQSGSWTWDPVMEYDGNPP